MSPYTDRGDGQVYQLQSIFIHEGSLSAGHYYCYNCTKRNGKTPIEWCLFNDNNVKRVPFEVVLEEAYGEKKPVVHQSSHDDDDSSDEYIVKEPRLRSRLKLVGGRESYRTTSSAYILVYVSEKQLDGSVCWKNESWVKNDVFDEMRLTISDYFRKETKEIHCYTITQLNSQHAPSLLSSCPVINYCWNDLSLSPSLLSLYAKSVDLTDSSQVSNVLLMLSLGMVCPQFIRVMGKTLSCISERKYYHSDSQSECFS